jgi:ferric-dicitrate binding protein FerR (iron transport regulator)
MNHFDEHIDEYIARYLAGETTPEEVRALDAWLGASAENRRYFDDIRAIWEKSPGLRPAAPRAVDVEAALRKVKSELGAARPAKGARPQTLRILPLWRAAAAVLLLAVAGYFVWQRHLPADQAVIVADAAALTDTLTDGSVITLSPQSGLALAGSFNTRERRVRLRGDARFKVSPDTTRPFVVETADLEVRVVGTEFTVGNAPDSAAVVIDVLEGKVRVSARGQSLLLRAGESALYDKNTGLLAQQNPAQNRLLRFDTTPLREVLQEVEKAYGIQITLKNKALEACPLTARYNNLPKDEVLGTIAETMSLQLTRTGPDSYILDGAACED